MSDEHDDPESVEQRLGSVEHSVKELRTEVGELRGKVDTLGDKVDKLRILVHSHDDQIKRIADVQSHYGEKLDHISTQLEPLREIRDFIRLVADNHERRITALERGGSAAQ
jgi:chromosome segregation ATPase